MPTTPSEDREVLISRTFAASKELIFEAWSKSDHLKNWYAPRGCSTPYCKVDFKVGGVLHICISNPNYGDCWCKGTYREIVPFEKIVYTLAFSDKDGNDVEKAPIDGHSDWPRETTVTIILEEIESKTKLTLHQTVSERLAKQTGAYPSWLEMLDRLAELISNQSDT